MKSTEQKTKLYEEMLPQLAALLEGETDEVSILANTAALLHTTMGWFWTGFYMVKPIAATDNHGLTADNENMELRLGPFQGPPACMHIGYGRGVCGTAWKQGHTIVVPDVELFPGHIACSSLSRSEIVVPLFNGRSSESNQACLNCRVVTDEDEINGDNRIVGVLDIDSRELSTFDDTDRHYLEKAMALLGYSL